MQQIKRVLLYGFALFAMFFGSGNLVFPIQIGQSVTNYWYLGFLGLFLTGIVLPFLGLFVIKLHKGSYNSFFEEAGTAAKIALPLFTLSLLGSFGVVPRCITVAHGGMSYLYPELPLTVFSLIFSVLTFLFCLKEKRMLKILGQWMSPVLIGSLVLLILVGIVNAPVLSTGSIAPWAAVEEGFITGYQTMDLFAAFFFSSLIFSQIQAEMPQATHRETVLFAIKPSILGALLLALIYFGFTFLGSHYAGLLTGIEPELMLPTIAKHIMGDNATLIIGIAMVFSCLTTAVALNNIYARYLCSLTKFKDSAFPWVLLGTTVISFMISLLDFKGIAAFLAPALEVSYPGIIVLTVLGIVMRQGLWIKKWAFYVITGSMVITTFLI